MKRTPLLTDRASDSPTLLYKGVALSVAPHGEKDVRAVPSGSEGGISLVVSQRSVRIRAFTTGGWAAHRSSVSRTAPRQIYVEATKGIAALLHLPNWRDVKNMDEVWDWIEDQIMLIDRRES